VIHNNLFANFFIHGKLFILHLSKIEVYNSTHFFGSQQYFELSAAKLEENVMDRFNLASFLQFILS
jgi:hypothetical protein